MKQIQLIVMFFVVATSGCSKPSNDNPDSAARLQERGVEISAKNEGYLLQFRDGGEFEKTDLDLIDEFARHVAETEQRKITRLIIRTEKLNDEDLKRLLTGLEHMQACLVHLDIIRSGLTDEGIDVIETCSHAKTLKSLSIGREISDQRKERLRNTMKTVLIY